MWHRTWLIARRGLLHFLLATLPRQFGAKTGGISCGRLWYKGTSRSNSRIPLVARVRERWLQRVRALAPLPPRPVLPLRAFRRASCLTPSTDCEESPQLRDQAARMSTGPTADEVAAKVASVHALLPVLQQQAATGAAAASAARLEIAEIAAREEAQAARLEEGMLLASSERGLRDASAALLLERSQIHATSLLADISAMDKELEAAQVDHAATVSELTKIQAQTNEEISRAAASVGVQLTRAAALSLQGASTGAEAHESRTGTD